MSEKRCDRSLSIASGSDPHYHGDIDCQGMAGHPGPCWSVLRREEDGGTMIDDGHGPVAYVQWSYGTTLKIGEAP